jgi:hypothetical protein
MRRSCRRPLGREPPLALEYMSRPSNRISAVPGPLPPGPVEWIGLDLLLRKDLLGTLLVTANALEPLPVEGVGPSSNDARLLSAGTYCVTAPAVDVPGISTMSVGSVVVRNFRWSSGVLETKIGPAAVSEWKRLCRAFLNDLRDCIGANDRTLPMRVTVNCGVPCRIRFTSLPGQGIVTAWCASGL